MKNRNSRFLYFLLALWIVISMSYYVLGTIALREEFFNSSHYSETPFDFEDDLQTVHNLSDAQRKLGLQNGSVLRSINGEPYSGWRQLSTIVRATKPGDFVEVGMTTPQGQEKHFKVPLKPREGPGFTVAGYIAFLVPILGVPLLGLLVGYWVVAGRPHDLNAWLVLLLLTFPETAFGNIDWRFFTGWTYPIFGVWNVLIEHLVDVGLLWFGIFFPERWRLDRRFPWVKWIVLAASLVSLCLESTAIYLQHYNVSAFKSFLPVSNWTDSVTGWLDAFLVLSFLAPLLTNSSPPPRPTPNAESECWPLEASAPWGLSP